MMFCEHIIIATDGQESYRISINKRETKEVSFNIAQSLIQKGCRLVELNSKSEVISFANDGFRNGFPADESNWNFFSDK